MAQGNVRGRGVGDHIVQVHHRIALLEQVFLGFLVHEHAVLGRDIGGHLVDVYAEAVALEAAQLVPCFRDGQRPGRYLVRTEEVPAPSDEVEANGEADAEGELDADEDDDDSGPAVVGPAVAPPQAVRASRPAAARPVIFTTLLNRIVPPLSGLIKFLPSVARLRRLSDGGDNCPPRRPALPGRRCGAGKVGSETGGVKSNHPCPSVPSPEAK